MEQTKLINNSFTSPLEFKPGVDLSDDNVEVFELVDHYEAGASGNATDFVVIKKPVKVDSYHHNKVIAQRAKGASLKEIVAMCERTGDTSVLNSRKPIYADTTLIPSTLGDALEKGIETRAFLASMSDDEINETIKLSKMSKSELEAYIANEVNKQLAASKKDGE